MSKYSLESAMTLPGVRMSRRSASQPSAPVTIKTTHKTPPAMRVV